MQRSNARALGDLARTTFTVLVIGSLLAVSLWILRPFLGPAIWATMLVVASWPLMLRTQRLLWGSRWLAVLVMSVLLLLLFLVPLALAIVTIVDNADRVTGWIRFATAYRLPEVPHPWLTGLPLVGGLIEQAWMRGTELGLNDVLTRLTPYAGIVGRWFVAEVGSIGVLFLQFLLTVVIAAVMYAGGESALTLVRRFARRLGGDRGSDAIDLAGGAIRGVALGVGVTAAVQALLGGIGVAAAGVPGAGLMAAVMFMLCLAQLGPLLVLVPAVLWVFYNGDTGIGIALAVWSGVVAMLDNVIRPALIRLGADLPLLLIFAGVIGGLFAVGLVGIFVGPVVLAVAYKLLEAWLDDGERSLPAWRD